MALGLNYPLMMALVVLPQALDMVIPGIVNNFVGLFMDTTLVSIVGMTDFLEAMNNAFKDPVWSGPTIMATGYVFAGMFYFAFCYGMTRYSAFVERSLARGRSQMTPPQGRPIAGRRRASTFVGVHKWYGDFPRAAQYQPDGQARRAHRRLRAVGVGQVDADPLHQPASRSISAGRSWSTASS